MNSDHLDKFYVSSYDEFLFHFDAEHPKSSSQQKEIKKHEKIAYMRDDKDYISDDSKIWEGF